MKTIVLVTASAALLIGCGSAAVGGSVQSPPPPSPVATQPGPGEESKVAAITCLTHYRSNVSEPLRKGPVVRLDRPHQSEQAEFEELVFKAVHLNDPYEGRSLNVLVSEKGRSHPLFNQLFQMEQDAAPDNIFGRTGQGFTGLLYAYSSNGAELQFICRSG